MKEEGARSRLLPPSLPFFHPVDPPLVILGRIFSDREIAANLLLLARNPTKIPSASLLHSTATGASSSSTTASEDRLTDLPDALRLHILSLLTLKYAIRTDASMSSGSPSTRAFAMATKSAAGSSMPLPTVSRISTSTSPLLPNPLPWSATAAPPCRDFFHHYESPNLFRLTVCGFHLSYLTSLLLTASMAS